MDYLKFKKAVETIVRRLIAWNENNFVSWAWETGKSPEQTAKELETTKV